MEASITDSIILDEGYSRGLLRAALREGYARPLGEPTEQDTKEIVTSYKRSRFSERALGFALLYPNVYLYHLCDALDLSPLMKELPIRVLTPRSAELNYYSYLRSKEGNQNAIDFAPAVLPRLGYLVRGAKPKAFRITKNNYNIFLAAVQRCPEPIDLIFDSKIFEFGIDSYATEFAVSKDSFLSQLQKNPENRKEIQAWITLKTIVMIGKISQIISDTTGLVEHSGKLRSPAAISWTIPASVQRSEYWNSIQDPAQAAIKCFYIFLKEVDAFPDISSIEDVLRLRNDPRIENWRNSIGEWASAIRSSSITGERKVRREIKAAMRDLRYVGKLRKVSGLLMFFSLPVAVAEAMIGVLGPGIMLSTFSTMAEIYSRHREWKLRWMFLGRVR